MNSRCRVGIYCRLSEEDRFKVNETDDSNSIINQKTLLTQYCIDREWDIYNIYSDDDFTGSDRNRPAFNQLLKDAEAHKIDIVLCKTQSRFTREIELVEKYINYLFPIWGVRFISVVDNADTAVKGNKKARQINGLINEWYLEDISENIKAVLTSRRKNGLFIGAFAHYGYMKDPNQKGHLIVDEEVAPVVQKIYSLFLLGYGRTAIARELNNAKIPTPTDHKIANGERFKCRYSSYNDHLWRYFMVSNTLIRTSKGSSQGNRYLRCPTRFYAPNECDGVSINYDTLYGMVLNEFRDISRKMLDEEDVASKVTVENHLQETLTVYQNQKKSYESKIAEIGVCIKNLYLDKIKNEIDEAAYRELMSEFTSEKDNLTSLLQNVQIKIEQITSELSDDGAKDKVELIRKYACCDEFTFQMVQIFIDKIVVHPKKLYSRDYNVDIYWNF